MIFWSTWVLVAGLGGTALQVQFPRAPLVTVGFAMVLLAVAAVRVWTGAGWPALGAVILALLVWYLPLTPRADRDWAPDVAKIVRGEMVGDQVTLHNVRAFRWHSATEAEEIWQTRRYDLSQLTGADMLTSVWGNPKIAHLVVSFGFVDGQRVVFSVEIRRERDEAFSSIGGFFRQFELALIAADESDIIRLRTNHRAEDVRLYPLRLTPDQLRAVFLRYVELGNDLNAQPRWYNTVTANCTSVVWGLVRVLDPDLPLNRALLLSGLLPDWLYRLGVLADTGDLAAIKARAAISARALALPDAADFSAAIRAPASDPLR
ncbi:Lnb N-terminal periplasmic domain-containing protein [Gemmobacter denitrificans]|uniref:DUF4105 domain-containing protein n=1 Tax=Gemmobacter denitrificans TaxID=3123040 RepID=A0ABU8BV90_9RHOB